MIIKSDAYYKAFQHSKKPIYSGDIIVTFEHGLVAIKQEAMGKTDRIAIHPRRLSKLIEEMEKVWAKNLDKIYEEGT